MYPAGMENCTMAKPLGETLWQAETVDEAIHKPQTVWDAQTTQEEMIRHMRPIQPGPDYVMWQRNRLDSAIKHMRNADRHRVMDFTNLTNPFNKRQRLAG
jgi:hypothetical protein